MFNPIEIPFGVAMLFNVVKLKQGVTIDDVELMLGEMCNLVKNTYGNEKGGFVGGQVFKSTGFVSEQGSIDASKVTNEHVAIVTYWKSFEQHETSHADKAFNEKFAELKSYCDDAYEIGYEMLWQGVPD